MIKANVKTVLEKIGVSAIDIVEEANRLEGDVAFLNEMCARMKTSQHFRLEVVPRGIGTTTIEWYRGSWDDDFVATYFALRAIARCIDGNNVENDAFMRDIAASTMALKSDGSEFDVISAVCDFIGSSWLAGAAATKLRALI
jgi:hypothetical protein